MMHVHRLSKRHGPEVLLLAAVLSLLIIAIQLASAQTLTTLYSFTGSPDGKYPSGALVMDAQGNLYGTTTHGGHKCIGTNGCGIVFKVAPSGTETVLHRFSAGPRDGSFPSALLQDPLGNVYGTTSGGGAYKRAGGVVFELTPTGTETVLYSFSGSPDGRTPAAGLIMDAQGNLYGTTRQGGHPSHPKANCGRLRGCGAVFELTSTGTETVLYSFSSSPDGAFPVARLTMDTRGNLYGTTQFGGANCGSQGCGTVFKLTPAGVETVLYSFCSISVCTDGAYPVAGLIMDAEGNLYGTTSLGGTSPKCVDASGCGTVFKLTPNGAEKVLYSFAGSLDGAYPYAGLIADAQGNLYGTTYSGGAYGLGTVFKLTSDGTETVLYSFCSISGCLDGVNPSADLIMDAQGNFYGTTTSGGLGCAAGYGCGTVFKLTP